MTYYILKYMDKQYGIPAAYEPRKRMRLSFAGSHCLKIQIVGNNCGNNRQNAKEKLERHRLAIPDSKGLAPGNNMQKI